MNFVLTQDGLDCLLYASLYFYLDMYVDTNQEHCFYWKKLRPNIRKKYET